MIREPASSMVRYTYIVCLVSNLHSLVVLLRSAHNSRPLETLTAFAFHMRLLFYLDLRESLKFKQFIFSVATIATEQENIKAARAC